MFLQLEVPRKNIWNRADNTESYKDFWRCYGTKIHRAGRSSSRGACGLELDIRRETLDFIGFELKRMREIGVGLGLDDKELEDHLSLLEKALLVEQEEDCYRLTPRCRAYLDEAKGYEWRR